ncbi:IS1595 family transposase [Citromicrobium bathyomarinum]|uniref:IS1595 family transposase n=1 Tax=Citromicrobium TaxID=72173 RepID=UPI0001DD0C22|nr:MULTISPECIES: IS1595 family transposase [Citromicrobium]ALG59781.1 transposase [Citromicrobium sp. JL477]KPM17124.1 transposase [Citromicrobium sp. JL1351]KPM20061.1 transposase [Citromicrobium sp. JL31]KPM24234.1 transposase [Citromicrobium sp. RCC1885]KPM27279.1 transposase [Citromicrobium sp. JL2201]|tara:strand:+ start:1179 stop:2135 length:957 start_codon:yes stop_codon:yes gene_type:complete
MSVLSSPHFHDEAKAFEYLESIVWADGVTCPHCGTVGGRVYDLSGVRTKPSKKNPEGKLRHGLKKCGECRKQFTVKVGTVFEHARLPLYKMLQAVHLMVSSKKGISAHQMSRILEVQYKSAWFLMHRIREAMRSGDLAQPFGNGGGAVEVDETYIGFKAGVSTRRGWAHKRAVVALVDRDSGKSKWFHVSGTTAADIHPIVLDNIHREARLMTDEAKMYRKIGRRFAEHGTTIHATGNYVDLKDRTIHTNTVEGAFSIFKRGMRGVYQHCAEHHLHRYLAEYEFRYNTRTANGFDDRQRGAEAVKGIVGKRLTYGVAN